MSGAEIALEDAIIAVLTADAGVQAVLGDPLRVVGAASAKPAYPYLEFVRHASEPAGSAGIDASRHVIDMAVVSRDEDGRLAKAAMAAVRAALTVTPVVMEGWRCVVLTPAFADALRSEVGKWRALLRIRALVEEA